MVAEDGGSWNRTLSAQLTMTEIVLIYSNPAVAATDSGRITIRAHQKNQVFRWHWVYNKRTRATYTTSLGVRALTRVKITNPWRQNSLAQSDGSGMATRNVCASHDIIR